MTWVRMVSDGRAAPEVEARVLSTWGERLRGLLGTDSAAGPVVLVRCSSIHTFGMRYGLDVALVGEGGEVLRSRRGLPPRARLSHPAAVCAIERPETEGEWFEEGERLRLVAMGPGAPETMRREAT